MAENKNAQQVREITDKLEQGIKELFESGDRAIQKSVPKSKAHLLDANRKAIRIALSSASSEQNAVSLNSLPTRIIFASPLSPFSSASLVAGT